MGTKTGVELVTASNGTNSWRSYFRYNCARMNYFHHDGTALFILSLKKVWILKIESSADSAANYVYILIPTGLTILILKVTSEVKS